jgi:Rieske 2Fe-2S family protein
VFWRQWLYAGHESEVPDHGDFITREVGGESVVVTRDSSGLHALFNVCRHRGARICREPRGNAQRLICPYHRWTYGLDGRLIAAPAMPETFVPAQYPLIEAHVRSWQGFVFINLSENEPEPLERILEPAASSFERFKLRLCKVAHAITYRVAANWKIVLDNFMECYHCPVAHPEFCRTFDLKRNPGGALGSPNLYVDFGEFMLKPGALSSTTTGQPVCRRLMGSLTEAELPAAVALTFRPTSSAIICGDYGVIHDFQPVSATETRVRCQWLVAADAEEGRDYDAAGVIELWDITNRQDWTLCEMTQEGMQSRRFAPGPNSPAQEAAVETFRSAYLTMMGEQR